MVGGFGRFVSDVGTLHDELVGKNILTPRLINDIMVSFFSSHVKID